MPLIKIQTSVKCSDEQKQELVLKLSGICASGIGKPESYVMSLLEDDAILALGGSVKNAAFVEVKSIGGLNGAVNSRLSSDICSCLEEMLGIPGSCVYINFTDVPASQWGCNGSTFG